MIGALFAAMTAAPGAVTVARQVLRSAIDRAHFAACLATGFRSPEVDEHLAACVAARRARLPAPSPSDLSEEGRALFNLRDHAMRTVNAFTAASNSVDSAAILALAAQVQQRLVALPLEDRAAVGVAIVRELLDDVAVRCVDLDRATRDAARLHGHLPTPERMAMAEELIAWATKATFALGDAPRGVR